MKDTPTDSHRDFFDQMRAAREQRHAMAAAFTDARAEMEKVFAAVAAAYPDFAVETLDDSKTHQFPSVKYQIVNNRQSESQKKGFVLHLAVMANPDRSPENDDLRSIGLMPRETPLLALAAKLSEKRYYAAEMLRNLYRLDQRGGFDSLVNDLGLYCGILYNGDDPRPVEAPQRALLAPRGRIFGTAPRAQS